MMINSNPAFNEKAFSGLSFVDSSNDVMTISGAVNKTILSIALTILGGLYAWYSPNSISLLFPTMIGGLILSFIIIFKKEYSGYLVPLYAVIEGIFLGALSLVIESKIGVNENGKTAFSGIAGQAVAFTFGTFFIMLFLYRYRIIRVTEKFRSIIISCTISIVFVYLILWVSSFFGVKPFIYGNSLASIGVSLFVIVIAAMNLMIDFDLVEKGVEYNAPKYMEWYSAFGILVTLIWLYVEMLRLLTKLKSRD